MIGWRLVGHDGAILHTTGSLAELAAGYDADVDLDCLSGIVTLHRAGRQVGYAEQVTL